jgi:death on curing protein
MTDDVLFFQVDDLLAIHRRMIGEFGGSPELRDRGLLESAAAMPEARFGGQFLHDGIPAMAAAYLFHICRNHPFVDGNKRAALTTAETFLLLNNFELQASNDELEDLTFRVASSLAAKDDVVRFFQLHAKPVLAGNE